MWFWGAENSQACRRAVPAPAAVSDHRHVFLNISFNLLTSEHIFGQIAHSTYGIANAGRLVHTLVKPHTKQLLNNYCVLTLDRGHNKIQNTLRKYHVLQSLIDFLEELERDMINSLTTKDAVTLFTLAKVPRHSPLTTCLHARLLVWGATR